MKGTHRTRYGERAELPCPLQRQHYFSISSSPNPVLWVFMKASLLTHARLSHWPLVTESSSSPTLLYPPWKSEGRDESSKTRITWLPPLVTSLHLWTAFQSHFINIRKDYFYHSLHLENSKFQECEPGIVDEDERYIFGCMKKHMYSL